MLEGLKKLKQYLNLKFAKNENKGNSKEDNNMCGLTPETLEDIEKTSSVSQEEIPNWRKKMQIMEEEKQYKINTRIVELSYQLGCEHETEKDRRISETFAQENERAAKCLAKNENQDKLDEKNK